MSIKTKCDSFKSVFRWVAVFFAFFIPPVQAAAVQTYTPVRAWIKTAVVSYLGLSALVSPDTPQWVAQHFDWFDSPSSDLLAAMLPYTAAPVLLYDNYYCLYVGGSLPNNVGLAKDSEIQTWCGQPQNASCTSSGVPFTCCTGGGTGTCNGPTYSAFSDPNTGRTYANGNDCHEGMFLHFSQATSITLTDRSGSNTPTRTLSNFSNSDCTGTGTPYSFCTGNGLQGPRIPTYFWSNGPSDTTMTQTNDRIFVYPNNPAYIAFNTWFQLLSLRTPSQGPNYNGIFVDNSGAGILGTSGKINSGGTIAEYNEPLSSAATAGTGAFDQGLVSDWAAVRKAFGPKGGANFQQWSNQGGYGGTSDWSALYPYEEGVLRELELQGYLTPSTELAGLISLVATEASSGVQDIIDSEDAPVAAISPITNTCDPFDEMANLAAYYIVSSSNTYFSRGNGSYGADPQAVHWFPAIEYNIGQPLGAASVIQVGVDPSKILLSGTKGVGSGNKFTDSSQSWTNGQWAWDFLQDSQGNVFQINGNGSLSGTLYLNIISGASSPASGPYEIASTDYFVYTRQFTNALVVSKVRGPSPSSCSYENSSSATSLNLPRTCYQLGVDGTVSTTPITSISLDVGQGAVLVYSAGSPSGAPAAPIPAVNGVRIVPQSGGN